MSKITVQPGATRIKVIPDNNVVVVTPVVSVTSGGGTGEGDMVLAGVQTVTGKKTFVSTALAIKGTGAGITNVTTANTSATSYTATLPAKEGTIAMLTDIPTVTGTNTGDETGDRIASLIVLANQKTTPATNDLVPISDAADAGKLKGVTWTNIKATLKNYFDTLYASTSAAGDMFLSSVQSVTGAKTFNSSALKMKGSSSGVTTIASANAGSDNYTQTIPAKAGTFAMTDDITDANLTTTDVTTNDATTSKHGFAPKATAPDAGNLNVLGLANSETGYANKLLLDTTSPSTQAFGDSAAAGSSVKAARVDHKHAMPAAPTTVTGSAGSVKSPTTTGVTQISGPSTGQTRVKTVSDADDTIMELGATQSVTGAKTFDSSAVKVKGSSTGVTTIASANTGSDNYTQTLPAKAGTFAMLTDITGTNSGTNTGDEPDASDTVAGVIEIATVAETNTGTDNTRAVSPDGLAGSNFGTKAITAQLFDGATLITTGNGKAYFRVPTSISGMNLVEAHAQVITKSTSGTPTVMIARGRQANATSDFTYADMLSTAITIDANEYDSKDATTAPVIDTSNDDMVTGDVIRFDVDASGTGTKGLNVSLLFRLP